MSAPKVTYEQPSSGPMVQFGAAGVGEESDFSKRLKKELEEATLHLVKILLHLAIGFIILTAVLAFLYAEGWLKSHLPPNEAPGAAQSQSVVGFECVATTDINLREGAGANTKK